MTMKIRISRSTSTRSYSPRNKKCILVLTAQRHNAEVKLWIDLILKQSTYLRNMELLILHN